MGAIGDLQAIEHHHRQAHVVEPPRHELAQRGARACDEQLRCKSRELLDAHLGSDHVSALLQRADELWGNEGEITVYEAVPAGEPQKGSLAEHAGG